jgi:hypothetical protein
VSNIYQQLGIIQWTTRQAAGGIDNDTDTEPTSIVIVDDNIDRNDSKINDLLTAMLKSIGLTREDVCITQDLASNKTTPRLILALGEIPAQHLLNSQANIDTLRGKTHHYGDNNIPLIVTYHPAHLLNNPSDKRNAYNDLLLFKTYLEQ